MGPLGGDLGSPGLDPRSAVDVHNLTKATDIGEQIAKRTAILRSALAEGAPEAQVVGGQAFVRPALGQLTSLFGARWGVTHYGIDIANAIGTPIYALTDGVVEESGPASGFGMWVVLRHPSGERTVYGHVNRAYVSVGQQVHAGEHIADIGNRGFSTGPHLHLEVWAPDGTKMNPIPWLARHGLQLLAGPRQDDRQRDEPAPADAAGADQPQRAAGTASRASGKSVRTTSATARSSSSASCAPMQ